MDEFNQMTNSFGTRGLCSWVFPGDSQPVTNPIQSNRTYMYDLWRVWYNVVKRIRPNEFPKQRDTSTAYGKRGCAIMKSIESYHKHRTSKFSGVNATSAQPKGRNMGTSSRPEMGWGHEPKHWEVSSSVVPQIDKDTMSYFVTVCKKFREDFEDEEDKALFMENVAAQTLEKEVQLSCNESTSDCMQMLLINTRNPSVLARFMASFLDNVQLMCTHHIGAYVMQTLLEAALRFLQHPSDYATIEEEDENVEGSNRKRQKRDGARSVANGQDDKSSAHLPQGPSQRAGSSHMSRLPSYHDKVVFWVLEAGRFCLENLEEFLYSEVASHVVRAVVQVLGGCYVERHLSRYRTTKKQRTAAELPKQAVKVVDVPEEFDELFRTFITAIKTQFDIIEIMRNSVTSLLLQALMMMLQLKDQERLSKLVNHIAKAVFSQSGDKRELPAACLDSSASFTVEEMLKRCSAKTFTKFWNKHLSGILLQMSLQPVSTFCAQRVIECATSAEQFQEMYEELEPGFDELFDHRQVSILVCIAAACKAHSVNQDRFIVALMKTLHCADPEDRHVFLTPLILYMTRYEDYDGTQQGTKVVYQGSVLLQHLFSFGKTKKVAQSLLAMGAQHLKAIACCPCGSHVLDAFLQSDHVKKTSKEKLVTIFKGLFGSLAMDKYGSCFVMNLWDSTGMAQKVAIAEELSDKEGTLTASASGRLVFKKLNLHHFIHRRNDWTELQKSKKKASALFEDILK